MLKKLFSLAAAAMAVFLFLGASAEAASWDLTGEAWKASSTQEKRAVIYGASNIIALEKSLLKKAAGRLPFLWKTGCAFSKIRPTLPSAAR